MFNPISAKTLVVVALAAAGALAACGKEETPVDKAVDKVGDALDMREHEKLKDAGENVGQAVEDAGEAVKDEAQDLKEEAQKDEGKK